MEKIEWICRANKNSNNQIVWKCFSQNTQQDLKEHFESTITIGSTVKLPGNNPLGILFPGDSGTVTQLNGQQILVSSNNLVYWYNISDFVTPSIISPVVAPTISDLKICLAGISYTKIGEFKLAYLNEPSCGGINNSNYAKGGYIFLGDKSDWTKIGTNTRNETWQSINLSATDLNGVNVINKVKPVADKLNIPDRITQQNPPFINYYLIHKTKNSSVVFNKCGYINDSGCNAGYITGMYAGNNWSTNSDPKYKQYVVDMITGGPAPVGTPLFSDNDVYELYFAITTDTNCGPSPVVAPIV